jgi:hypothetical protein
VRGKLVQDFAHGGFVVNRRFAQPGKVGGEAKCAFESLDLRPRDGCVGGERESAAVGEVDSVVRLELYDLYAFGS